MLNSNKIYKNNKNIILDNMKVGKKYDINDLKIEGLNRKEMKDLLSALVNDEKLKVIIDENNKKKYIIYTDALKNKERKEEIKKNYERYKGGYIKRIECAYKSKYVCSFYYKNNLVLEYLSGRCAYYTIVGVAILDKKKVKELSKNVIDRIVNLKKNYRNGGFAYDRKILGWIDVIFDKNSFHSTGPQFINKYTEEYPKYANELLDYLYKFIEENGEVASGKGCFEKISNIFPELKDRL